MLILLMSLNLTMNPTSHVTGFDLTSLIAPFAGNALKGSGALGAGYVPLRHDRKNLARLCCG